MTTDAIGRQPGLLERIVRFSIRHRWRPLPGAGLPGPHAGAADDRQMSCRSGAAGTYEACRDSTMPSIVVLPATPIVLPLFGSLLDARVLANLLALRRSRASRQERQTAGEHDGEEQRHQ